MTKEDLLQRLQLCNQQHLDFVSLRPIAQNEMYSFVYHHELECGVPTKYCIQPAPTKVKVSYLDEVFVSGPSLRAVIEKLPEAIAR